MLLLWVAAESGAAQDRVVRDFGQEHGLSATPVWDLEQDSLGFIWIAAEGGLFRFDGSEIRRWAPGQIEHMVMDVAISPSGRIIALDARGRLHEVEGSGARRVELPWERLDSPRRVGRMLAFDEGARLWLRYGDEVGVLEGGRWSTLTREAFGGEVPTGVVRATSSGAFVVTSGGLWRVRAGEPATRVLSADPGRGEVVVGVDEAEPGRVLVLLNVTARLRPEVVEVVGGVRRPVPIAEELPPSRAIAVRERGGTLWLALDRYLAAVRPGERPELLGPEDGFPSGGPMLVDREGSLWLGSFVGLHQYPEPETRTWAERQGMPSRHTRFLARAGSTLWVMTWNGPATLERRNDGWRVGDVTWDSRAPVCRGTDGRIWSASDLGVVELRDEGADPWPGLPSRLHGCAAGRDGAVWFGTADAILHLDPASGRARRFAPPVPGSATLHRPALLHDAQDRLWVGAGASVCHAPVVPLFRTGTTEWTCDEVASESGVFDMVEVDGGRFWVSGGPVGLLEYDGTTWRAVAIPDAPTQTVHAVIASPRGGVWVASDGALVRGRPDDGPTIEVLERLTGWHGLAASAAGHVAEDESGDLWLATNYGVVGVPASVRFAEPSVPRVALVAGSVDGDALDLGERLVLPHDRNRLELRFAALTFRHRAGLRHQVRLSSSQPWTESSGEPTFRWVDLPSGTYHAEYRASRDGRTWSPRPAGFTFEVRPPWYTTPWALLFAAATLAALAGLIYRARVGYLLDLEQQRTRIAMDLHDQVGSGLASVGILSGVMATEELDSDERRRTAAEIATVAEELGHALSDIVWSLDPETAGLEELGSRLAEHGGRLFPDEAVRFDARFPGTWPAGRSSVRVRRNVLLIGLEALHNAARHAGARKVKLSLLPAERGVWRLAVEDDGRGLAPATGPSPRGNGDHRGLEGMRRRADAIGARLEVTSRAGEGTRVELWFAPERDTSRRMIMRRRRPR